jgi:hypothetical protein
MQITKKFLFNLLLFLLPLLLFGHTHQVNDTICFKVPTFQCELDSLVKRNPFVTSFQKYELENKRILASAKQSSIILND